MQLPVQHANLGGKTPTPLAAQTARPSRAVKPSQIAARATATVEKPSTSNGVSNGHAAYTNGSSNGNGKHEGPIVMDGEVGTITPPQAVSSQQVPT